MILISTFFFFLANALLEMLVLEWDHFSFIILTTPTPYLGSIYCIRKYFAKTNMYEDFSISGLPVTIGHTIHLKCT